MDISDRDKERRLQLIKYRHGKLKRGKKRAEEALRFAGWHRRSDLGDEDINGQDYDKKSKEEV